MANFTTQFRVGGLTGTPNAFVDRNDGYNALTVDTSKWVAGGVVKGDVVTLIAIPARSKFILDAIYMDNTISFGTTPTFSLGDSAAGTTFINAQTPGAANTSIATMALQQKTYDTANAITVTINNASGTFTSGVFTMIYRVLDLSANPVATATPSK